MYIYFGTIARGAPVLHGGSLLKLDWDSKSIIHEVAIYPQNPRLDDDPNVRGNVRGCRGIRRYGDELVVADYHSLNFFDHELNFKRKISHGLMVGLHEIDLQGDSVWVTSTAIDAALKYSLKDGQLEAEHWPRETPGLAASLNLEALSINKGIDNRRLFLEGSSFRGPSHLHLNAVCEFRGEVYALLHSKNIMVNLTTGVVVIDDPHLKHAHNLIIEEPGVVYINDTHRTVIREYNLASGKQIRAINIRKMKGIKALLWRTTQVALKELGAGFFSKQRKATARPLYLRGLAINDKYIFAGFSPATIVRIDKHSGELIDFYYHSNDARLCIHGLEIGI